MHTIEVDRSRAVRVDFFNHHVELPIRQLVIKFPQDFAQTRRRDVTVSCTEISVIALSGLF